LRNKLNRQPRNVLAKSMYWLIQLPTKPVTRPHYKIMISFELEKEGEGGHFRTTAFPTTHPFYNPWIFWCFYLTIIASTNRFFLRLLLWEILLGSSFSSHLSNCFAVAEYSTEKKNKFCFLSPFTRPSIGIIVILLELQGRLN
jgi:hypothetical protein